MEMWDIRSLTKTNTVLKEKEKIERRDSVRVLPMDFEEAQQRTTANRAEDSNRDKSSSIKSGDKKRKEGLIVVKQFVLYGLFVLALTHCYLYQASFENPSYCLPNQRVDSQGSVNTSQLPYQCYESCSSTGLFGNHPGSPEYALSHSSSPASCSSSSSSTTEETSAQACYYVRGYFPQTPRLVHFVLESLCAGASLFYAIWRFARHLQCAKLHAATQAVGAIAGLMLFLGLLVACGVSLFGLDPVVRAEWVTQLRTLDENLQVLSAAGTSLSTDWLATLPRDEVIAATNATILAYTSGTAPLYTNAASVYRTTVDFTDQSMVTTYCKAVCGADPSCVGFYLRSYSLELSTCADVYSCDFYSSLDLAGAYVEPVEVIDLLDADETVTAEQLLEELLAAQAAYAADPASSLATIDLTTAGDDNSTDSAAALWTAAEEYCQLLDPGLVPNRNSTVHGVNATNVTLYRLINRTGLESRRARAEEFLQLLHNDSAPVAAEAARAWHENLMVDCKAAAFAASGYTYDDESEEPRLNSSSFLSFSCASDGSGDQLVTSGLNVTSEECLEMIPEYTLRILASSPGIASFELVDVRSGDPVEYSAFNTASSVLQVVVLLMVVLLIAVVVLSGITVATRLISLITRVERCTNCEMRYTLKQQPLLCSSCDDIFCKFCLVYNVKGRRGGLFASEVSSAASGPGANKDPTIEMNRDTLVCMDCFTQSFDKSVGTLLKHSLGQQDLATGYLNYLLTQFVELLEHKNYLKSKGRLASVMAVSAAVSDPLSGNRKSNSEVVHSEDPLSDSNISIKLRKKAPLVKALKSQLRRAFGDMVDFRADFMQETLSVINTLHGHASALSQQGLLDFYKQTHKFPRSSFIDVFLDRYNVDIERALSTPEQTSKVEHLRQFTAIFDDVVEFTQNQGDLDPDSKPLVLANSYAFDEMMRQKFRGDKDSLYNAETAQELPNKAVLEFGKKFWALEPEQQSLFHEQLLWHSDIARASFRATRASATAAHNVFVVMMRPFSSTAAPSVYHMYVLDDFLAFFNVPPGFDDPCFFLDPDIMSEAPTQQSRSQRLQAQNQFLFEDFFDGVCGSMSGTGGAKESKEGPSSSSSSSSTFSGAMQKRRVSLHDLGFILTRSDIPSIAKTASISSDFGLGGGVMPAEATAEGAHKAKLQHFARGKTLIVLKGIFDHSLEVVVARKPNESLGLNLNKVAGLQTKRLFQLLLGWQTSLPTASHLGILRFESSYPPREDGDCKFYLNGLTYFRDVVEAIGAARYNVMIADWCMSPRIYLRRESGAMQTFRFDLLIQRKARQGVQIFVLLYKDIAIGLGSDFTEDYLVKLHANVHVVRHNCLKSTVSDKIEKIYYSHHQKCCVVDNSVAFVGGIDLCYGRFETPDYTLKDIDGKWFPGHSYKNPQLELEGGDPKSHINEPFLTPIQINRHHHWRMPWNDVHSCVTGKAAADVSLMLVQRWQTHNHTNGTKTHIPVWPGQLLRDWNIEGCWKAGSVQLLRSMACWSGNEMVETSIYRCYLEMIRTAKHSIYIENQFFISAIEGNNTVHNRICQALFDRIMIAINKKETFRVIVVVPFHADGPLHSEMAMSVLHYLRASVAFTPTSLLQCLARECGKIKDRAVNLEDYIIFVSLAQWDEMTYEHVDQGFSSGEKRAQQYGKQPVYTQVYTHSKLMVVDDFCAIVGSANINDRSMLGDRDSEMAVYVEDRELITVQMGSKEVTVGKNMHRFRMRLMNKILSNLPEDTSTSNLTCDEVYRDILLRAARDNTDAYHAVFPDFPHTSYTSMQQYDEAVAEAKEKLLKMPPAERARMDAENIRLLKRSVHGLVCQFPLKFFELDPTLIVSSNLKATIADAVSGGAFFT